MEVIDAYIATWNERDPKVRRSLVDQVFAEDARYVDPLAVAEGRAHDATVAAVQRQFPEFVFRLGGLS